MVTAAEVAVLHAGRHLCGPVNSRTVWQGDCATAARIAHLEAALAAAEAKLRAVEARPCDDYEAPLTCWTTPKPKTQVCEGCRAAFPNGPEVRRLYGIPSLPFVRGDHEVVITDDLRTESGGPGQHHPSGSCCPDIQQPKEPR